MGMGASGLRTGWLAAFGTEGYVIMLEESNTADT
jgi:hypothetical protein